MYSRNGAIVMYFFTLIPKNSSLILFNVSRYWCNTNYWPSLSFVKLTSHCQSSSSGNFSKSSNLAPHAALSAPNSISIWSLFNSIDFLINMRPSRSFITSRTFKNNKILFSIRESHMAFNFHRESICDNHPSCIWFIMYLKGRSYLYLTRSSIIDILSMSVLTTFL